MQAVGVWYPGLPPEPGCARAKPPSGPGSGGTLDSGVFLQPGSLLHPRALVRGDFGRREMARRC